MANHKSNEVVNGTSSHEQFEAAQGDVAKLGQPGSKKKGRPRKKEKMDSQTPRVLRSRSQEKPKAFESVEASSQDVETKEKKRKKMKKIKKDQNDEFSKIRTHLRYLLQRMNYEQLFIDAYAGEGWKGQSLEKLRPEKELQRAKTDINRFKVRIRDLFQKIDKSCEEGRFPETLYDSDGLIDSEDIFCAKCAQKEVRLDNDIILCDGFCDRGFHQFCLDPPLLKEQVPPGDEGWLCPACDCKVDCIDSLNDQMGTDLSINDTWEKVFPETAAGNKLDDLSGLPSDDSEDDDYNPDGPHVEEDEVDVEDPSSDDDDSNDSDFSSASEDLGAVANNNNNNNNVNEEQYLGLPSDDSEDDDFNPDKADSDENSDEDDKTKNSGSDFSSDSEEDLADVSKNEVKESVVSEKDEEIVKTDVENDDSSPILARRRVQRLDYKKLHDEAYGNLSSDSSDEDFSDSKGPKRRKNTRGQNGTDSGQKKEASESTTTPVAVKGSGKKVDVEGKNGISASKGSSAVDSGAKSGAKSSYGKYGEAVTQRLYETFKENKYPDRNIKDNLTKELNLTLNQVNKWFENARRSTNHPGQHRNGAASTPTVGPTPEKSTTNHANGEKSTTPAKSSKRKAKANENENENGSPMDLSSQSARRSGRVRAKRL